MKKICIIINKQIKWLNLNKLNYSIIYSGVVFDRDCQSLRVREHDDGELYIFGKPIKNDNFDCIDCHEIFHEIPSKRYVYAKRKFQDISNIDFTDMTIIAMPKANDFESYLAIAAFLRINNISSDIRCLKIDGDVKDKISKTVENLDVLPCFNDEFSQMIEKRKEENFKSIFPISRNFWYLQAETGMTNKEFAEYFGTSVRNVENWRSKPSSLSDFIYDLFEYKLLKEGII